ncbi:MAG: hypothetical protein GY832_16375 [Chloroflexi bacterium]|nr:hypothetical protein [Chloroflexota bacterium]
MNITFEDFGADDKLVIRGATFGVASNVGILILLAVLIWWKGPQLLAILLVLQALVIMWRFGREETCTLDKLAGTVTIERAGVQGKRVTKRALAEIVGVGIKTTYIREGRSNAMYNPPMLVCHYYAYLLDRSGEYLDVPGTMSKDFDEVSNAAEKIRCFLKLGAIFTDQ